MESDATTTEINFVTRHTMTNSSSTAAVANTYESKHRAAAAGAEIHRCFQTHTRTSCSSVQQYNHLSGPGTLLWNLTRCLKRRDEKKRYTKKKRRKALRESSFRPHTLEECELPFNVVVRDSISEFCLSGRMNRNLDILTKRKAPPAGRRHENSRGSARQSRERRARWGTSSNHHTE